MSVVGDGCGGNNENGLSFNDKDVTSCNATSTSTSSSSLLNTNSANELSQRIAMLEKQQSEMFFLFRQKTERMEIMIGGMKDSIDRMEVLLSTISARMASPAATSRQTSSWDKALGLLSEERVDEAFRCVLESHDPQTLFKLMDISGPSIQSLKSDTLCGLFDQIVVHMSDDSICRKKKVFCVCLYARFYICLIFYVIYLFSDNIFVG